MKKLRQIFHKRDEVFTYISQGVSVYDFFRHFKGQFEGKNNSLFPPRTSVASAVANRLTKHLSDLQIHNGLPRTVLEADVGKLCHCWVCITSK